MKKNRHSKDMQNHKKPMNKKVLEEEFSSEFGDYNAGKIIETLEVTKPKKKKEKKQNKKRPLRRCSA
ncbi:hypothetical protein [Bacillus inaquosorum]|uniref:YkzE n=1 Tax=Bacillus inaquosorum TaxID=483913 RepID=A0A9Q4ETH6_9BACI|nr:hypothetical protein [Bacillus inaquosorum]MCY9230684.1 hypothetical protein [Bacillus inaquosorum]